MTGSNRQIRPYVRRPDPDRFVVPTGRLFVDESGDHAPCPAEAPVKTRYLGVIGVAMRMSDLAPLAADLKELKSIHFGDVAELVFHAHEIRSRSGVYGRLRNPSKAQSFDLDLLSLLEAARFDVVAVVIDKLSHGAATHRRNTHPYYYAAEVLFERYGAWLRRNKAYGDVVAEARGPHPDRELKEAYRMFFNEGSYYERKQGRHNEQFLSTRELKLEKKSANVPALQIADIIAFTAVRDVLQAHGLFGAPEPQTFAAKLSAVMAKKYYRRHDGRALGYGQVLRT